MSRPMRICVFGAGAIGGHLAAKLAAAQNEVSVVARGANLEAIRARGDPALAGVQRDAAAPPEAAPPQRGSPLH